MAPLSRIRRLEEKKLKKRMVLALGGTIAIIAFIALFGLNILTFFSLGIDSLRGESSSETPGTVNLLLPPVLDPLPEATNSGVFALTGRGQAGTTLIVYVNGAETKKLTVDDDGSFRTPLIDLDDGENSISAKVVNDGGTESELSEIMNVTVVTQAPELEVTEPEDGAEVHGDPGTIRVAGRTKEGTFITINDRLVVVGSDGSFSYDYRLNEGENILKIVTKDAAGNTADEERKVVFYK